MNYKIYSRKSTKQKKNSFGNQKKNYQNEIN